MTRIFLVRHGMNDLIGNTIAGRMPGVYLNAEGRLQAQRLVPRLARESIQRIFSSPMERCRETAEPLCQKLGLKPEILPNITEIGYGDWTGRTLAQLQPDPEWQRWNSARTLTRVPGGETMLEIQNRMVAEVQRLHTCHPGETLALFSHGDPIKTVICFFLGVPLDFFQRLEISPASISLLCLDHKSVHVSYVNDETATHGLDH